MSDPLPVNMSDNEKEQFRHLIKERNFYLEYGCGDSTLIALEEGCARVVSVETDANWIARLREREPFLSSMTEGRLFFEHADVGPVGGWGFPVDQSHFQSWPTYATIPFVRHDYVYDVILIDGRFRQASALVAYNFMTENSILVMHDYTNRQHYHEVEKFFSLTETYETLAVFKKKKNILYSTYCISLLKSILDPR